MPQPPHTLQRFELGRSVATPGALNTLTPLHFRTLLFRHRTGDWSALSDDDHEANERALHTGERVFSAYDVMIAGGKTQRVWVITEADRSSTCVLLPDEY